MNENSTSDNFIARKALWAAICKIADSLKNATSFYLSTNIYENEILTSNRSIPNIPNWKLVEVLSLMTILLKSEKIITKKITNLVGKTGPIHFIENGLPRFLWAQPSLTGLQSDLGGRPDILITSDEYKVNESTTLRIIECKCQKNLGTQQIRAEYAKAMDLKVNSYLIWSFTTPSQRIIDGAKRLGLDVGVLGFDKPESLSLTQDPDILISFISNIIYNSKQNERFVKTLVQNTEIAKKKSSFLLT